MSRPNAIDPEFGEELQLPGFETKNAGHGPGSRGHYWPYQQVDFGPMWEYARRVIIGDPDEASQIGAGSRPLTWAEGGDSDTTPHHPGTLKRKGEGQSELEITDSQVGELFGRSRRSIIRYRMAGTISRCAVERIANHMKLTPWDFYPDWYE